MALVSAGRFLTVAYKDTGGNETTRTYELVATTDTQAQIDAGIIIVALDAVTDANLVSYSVSEKFVQNAFVLPTGAEIENQLQVTLPVNGKPNKSGTITIPAPVAGVFVAATGEGWNTPDFLDGALLSYLNLFTVGGVARFSDGEVATLVNARGKRVHAKSTRG